MREICNVSSVPKIKLVKNSVKNRNGYRQKMICARKSELRKISHGARMV